MLLEVCCIYVMEKLSLPLSCLSIKDDGNSVRTVAVDNEPWFVAKDICAVLEVKNSRDALKHLDDDEKSGGSFKRPPWKTTRNCCS